MIVWGGDIVPSSNREGTGGRYCACPNGQLVYRDSDGDGRGNPTVPAMSSCDGIAPTGYATNNVDCNDADPNNWSSCSTCVDTDADQAFLGCDIYVTLAGPDCNDALATVGPNAPEVNDGIDNQCAGDGGFGDIDEISGMIGFSTPEDKAELSWMEQSGATSYDVLRSTIYDFSTGCTHFATSQSAFTDADIPPEMNAFYYLVRPGTPHMGSWGRRGDGSPRSIGCP